MILSHNLFIVGFADFTLKVGFLGKDRYPYISSVLFNINHISQIKRKGFMTADTITLPYFLQGFINGLTQDPIPVLTCVNITILSFRFQPQNRLCVHQSGIAIHSKPDDPFQLPLRPFLLSQSFQKGADAGFN